MRNSVTESALQLLAERLGIVIAGADTMGDHDKTDSMLVRLLARFGLPITDPAEAEEILLQEQVREWQSLLDPVLVRFENEALLIPARFPDNTEFRYQWTLREEGGATHTGTVKPADLAADAFFEHDGCRYARRFIAPGLDLPCGYHELILHREDESPGAGRPGMQVIIAPRQCFIPPGLSEHNRIWGLGVHLHAIRSRHNWGIGDFSDLQEILNWSAEQGAGIIHTAPLNDLAGADAGMLNPYSPSSRSLLNTLFLDVEKIADLPECEEAAARLQDVRFQARLSALRESSRIDYQAVGPTKEEILRLLWRHFSTNHLNPETDRGREFRAFQQQGGELLRHYGIFNLLRKEYPPEDGYRDWTAWPEPLRNPWSKSVADFAEGRQNDIEYFQYLQWQAALQLNNIGRRSMERGLKAGLLGELPYGPAPSGFETWYYREFFTAGAAVAAASGDEPAEDPAAGLPLFQEAALKKFRFRPLIEALRHAMRNTGAVLIRSPANYARVNFTCAETPPGARTAVRLPFADILGIIALESRRGKCLVIADKVHLLPEEEQRLLRDANIFSSLVLFRQKDAQGDWLPAARYPHNALVSASPPFLATVRGFWAGSDIAAIADAQMFRDEKEKEKAIIGRTSDRARLLITLDHAALLPEGRQIDPAAVPELDRELLSSLLIYLVKSPAKIFLVSFNDLLLLDKQAEPPGFPVQEFWTMRYPGDLEKFFADSDHRSLFASFCRERGIGVTRPSAPAVDRRKGTEIPLPSSFYRLQLHREFTFRDAMQVIPYLEELGISHCYVSPFLTARPGSPHGYDIIDHSQINPEIGSRAEYEQFVAVLEQYHLAMILDVVPNHMGVGSDNQWWMDVLENGEASEFADYFDINWQPQQEDLSGRVLLPVLGEHYGKVLESSELSLRFVPDSGNFVIHYYEHRFPVAPETYPLVLNHNLTRLEDKLGRQHNGYLEFQNLITSFENLPGHREIEGEKPHKRRRHKEINKRILARLCREYTEIRLFIEENVVLINGEQGKPESYDLLHNLLELQAYRLAFWRVAADEINYRRFFDINDLAGLRMEKMEVFQATHGLILDLVTTGKLDGLRIDHPDGLYDPFGYFSRLQAAASGELLESRRFSAASAEAAGNSPLYIVIEKILADFEHLPLSWPVHGTTGYDFLNMVNGLFVDSAAEKTMTRIYHRFIRTPLHFDELVYRSKKLIIRSLMSGEVNTLTTSLYRIAQGNRYTRDFRLNRLRDALMEIVACFPVYRTYITSGDIHKSDAQFIEWAVEKAKQRKQLDDAGVYDFIKNILLVRGRDSGENDTDILDFCMKFQQYTGPVMAKGLEDTSFYIYNRLVSLNEVGGEPKRFGASVAAFHHTSNYRLRHWPGAMLNTSTHDTKRSEDVRARINVLTEMPEEWRKRIVRWSRLNRPAKIQIDDWTAPTRNDEYGFYQNLLGIWPAEIQGGEARLELIERMKSYMLKACRESKEHTSWITPSEPYENAITHFVEETLKMPDTAFLQDFIAFHRDIAWFGMLNSLSQVLLKLTSPGIPDIYQGNETWRFCLVDPDNRRPVDFTRRQEMLRLLLRRSADDQEENRRFLQDLFTALPDGRAKMFVIASTLRLRKEWKEIFDKGAYLPLEAGGDKFEHICAFARKYEERVIVTVAPRLYYKLMHGGREAPVGRQVWQETVIRMPEYLAGMRLHNVYSGETVSVTGSAAEAVLKVADVLQAWPVGLLQGTIE